MNITLSGVGAAGMEMPAGGPPPGMRQAVGAVADRLGMSADELGGRLRGGDTLARVAAEKGVSRDDAIGVLSSALRANAPQGVSMSPDRATAIATRLFDSGPPPVSAGQGMPATGGMARLSGAFSAEEDGGDILSRLMSGEDPRTVGDRFGIQRADLLELIASRLQVDDRA